ncbi:hypothetical protein WH47_08963 [Habropoda laboriosa]|uniref:CHK kinase-like domain-containing protein n=1 Tax=Habropoda laboriosa TaxID=597456 RepID=A0A0L7R6R7_9HYME|nr:PREDICTED: uncharacterized protein LOC108571429 [Habropoda laboriosa]XP_017788956.1 PREDICTED: uncharacterized protein LOC108571429 [Habropoda laboriosa]XP_017788957.1 PREDICTED: uncharacterized protein LOC108571429 [Habropoda laboriosa]KOC66570.1 hypothetical protein WH47_08963 [Habropoda laboriosa]
MAQETPSWVNIDFTQRILRLAEDDSTIQVVDIFIKPATNKGDNYTSDMMRVAIEYTRKQGDKEVSDKKTLIFKFEPIAEGPRKELIQMSNIFETEICMMTDALKKMSGMLGIRLGARVYHVRMERPLCLIMEDLAPRGFRMADRQMGLDLAHSTLAIQGLARFHGSSVALCEKEPKHKDVYRKGIFHAQNPKDMTKFFQAACTSLALEIEKWPEFGESYGQKLKILAENVFEKGVEAVKRNDNEFNVINHGDFWVNNMLFRYDENNKPVEHIFVDFQLALYTSPAIDLHYFLNTSPSEKVRDDCIDSLLDEYLKTLTATMKQLGCKTQPPTKDALLKSMEERAIYGLISMMTVLPVIVVDKSEVKDIDEMLGGNGIVESPGMKSPIFRRIMQKKLPKYAQMGLLD